MRVFMSEGADTSTQMSQTVKFCEITQKLYRLQKSAVPYLSITVLSSQKFALCWDQYEYFHGNE